MKTLSTFLFFLSAVTDGPDLTDISEKVNELIGTIWTIALAVAAGCAVILGLVIGAKYALSLGEEQKKKSAQSALKTFLIGTAIIFIIAAVAGGVMSALAKWANVSFGAY